jgi:hypothetical protein
MYILILLLHPSSCAVINGTVAGRGSINTVSDGTGKTLITKNITVQKGNQTIAVDINSLTPWKLTS